MYFRCPGCSTVHPVNAALLAQGGGRFRCGKCNKVSNALESLFDEWPQAGQPPAPRGELPVLGMKIDLEEAQHKRLDPDDAKLTGEGGKRASKPPGGRPWLRLAWMTVGLVLLIAVSFQLAEYAGHPLIKPGEIDAALIDLGLREAPPPETFRDTNQIHLVARELASDPLQAGVLRLRATIVNRASRSQPYPELEVVLLDAAGKPLATRRFNPRDYLAAGTKPGNGMSPHAYLPLNLELDDPGEQAVGFELNFR